MRPNTGLAPEQLEELRRMTGIESVRMKARQSGSAPELVDYYLARLVEAFVHGCNRSSYVLRVGRLEGPRSQRRRRVKRRGRVR
jgi:hypothetical protein